MKTEEELKPSCCYAGSNHCRYDAAKIDNALADAHSAGELAGMTEAAERMFDPEIPYGINHEHAMAILHRSRKSILENRDAKALAAKEGK